MFVSVKSRLATLFIAVGAALMVVIGGTGVAAAALPGATGDQSSDNLRWNLSVTAVNGTAVDPSVAGTNVVHPGDTVTVMTKIFKSSGIGRYMTGIRQIQPAGFQYLSNTTSKLSTVTDEGAAGVKAVCTGGGCSSVPILGNKGYLDNIDFAVTYKIPANQAFGDYKFGFVFDVYSFSTQQGGNPSSAGVTVVDPSVSTTTTLNAPATAKTGDAVDLTANVGPANAVGTVQFKDGDQNIGTPVTVSGGNATLSHTFTTPGDHSITAVFTAGAGFHDSTSAASTVKVDADTNTTLQVQATALVNDDVQLTATVAPSTATGTVQFKDNGTNIGEPVTVSNGSASLTQKYDEAGNHSFTAVFTGTAGYNDSTAPAVPLEVKDADFGTTTVIGQPVTATVGVSENLAATVRPIPSGGDVTFSIDGVEIGTAPVGTGDGVAVLPHTFTTAGTASVVAKFNGTNGFTASTSEAFTVTVKAPDTRTATTTTLSVAGTSTVGQNMTLTANVAPAGAGGTVQFKSGTTPIGAPVQVTNGVATLTYAFTADGTFAITADFTGDNDYKDSVSAPTVVKVAANSGGTGGSGSLSGIFGS